MTTLIYYLREYIPGIISISFIVELLHDKTKHFSFEPRENADQQCLQCLHLKKSKSDQPGQIILLGWSCSGSCLFLFSGSKRQSSCSSAGSYQDLEVTHRGMHRFIPRHADEMPIEIGDPLHVIKTGDDLWCEGMALCMLGNFAFFFVVC